MSKKIIEAMNGYVVEMTEKRAKKARKMIEGKGMKVDEEYWIVGGDLIYLQFATVDNTFNIVEKLSSELLMPWKKFKAMFQKKKKEHNVEVNEMIDWSKIQVVESENFTIITSGNHKETRFSGFIIKAKLVNLRGQYRSDLVKEHFKLCKDQTIKFG